MKDLIISVLNTYIHINVVVDFVESHKKVSNSSMMADVPDLYDNFSIPSGTKTNLFLVMPKFSRSFLVVVEKLSRYNEII
jgi:hypothetical protein